jgi:hypothetical protein
MGYKKYGRCNICKTESEDNFGMYKGWAKKRESVYKKLGYAIYAKEEEK